MVRCVPSNQTGRSLADYRLRGAGRAISVVLTPPDSIVDSPNWRSKIPLRSSPEEMSNHSEQLEAFLRLKLGGSVSIAGGLQRLQGGFDTDTFAFAVQNAPPGIPEELVLRLFRSSGESDRVNLESTIQNTIHAAGHPVPRVPIDSGGHSLIGRPFLIMERLEGSTLASGLEDQSLFEKLPGLMGNLQVGIHETDSADLRTQLADAEVDIRHMTPRSMLERVSKLAEASGVAELTAIRQWLTERWPTQPVDPVICHATFIRPIFLLPMARSPA